MKMHENSRQPLVIYDFLRIEGKNLEKNEGRGKRMTARQESLQSGKMGESEKLWSEVEERRKAGKKARSVDILWRPSRLPREEAAAKRLAHFFPEAAAADCKVSIR